jgi:hypothetical protein
LHKGHLAAAYEALRAWGRNLNTTIWAREE